MSHLVSRSFLELHSFRATQQTHYYCKWDC